MNNKKSLEEHQRDYRWLAEQVREAAEKASTQQERAELLGRAKLWDERCPHHPALND
jgi:hypothetical protein